MNNFIQSIYLGYLQELRLAQEFGITCPKEHEELEEKYSTLQQKFRDMAEKLNLGETVVMYERAEMAEQAWEKIRSATATFLDEFNQVLEDLTACPGISNERYNTLKAIYEAVLDIQNDERKASVELINHEIYNT